MVSNGSLRPAAKFPCPTWRFYVPDAWPAEIFNINAMDVPNKGVQARLAALRHDYAQKLPGRLAAIAGNWQRLCNDAHDAVTLDSLIHQCHKLAGSATTFGFPDVTALARDVEHLLRVVQSGEHTLIEVHDQIDIGLNALAAQGDLQPTGKPAAHPASATPIPASPCGSPIYVAVAPDDSRATLCEQLAHHHFEVGAFATGKELLDACRGEPPAALIVDAELPDMTASNVLEELRDTVTRAIPSVVVSADGSLTTRLSAVRAGASAFFTRPPDMPTLLDEIDALIRQRRSDPYRILIIDDDADNAQYVAHTLEDSGMRTAIVTDPLCMLQALEEFRPELILMDLYMPAASGAELVAVIRQQHNHAGTPIVYLSAESETFVKLSAMKHGADDFISKPIAPEHLVSTILARVQRFRQIRSLVINDSLTGLLDHGNTRDKLAAEVARAARNGHPLSFAMLDIDNFKEVNDTYGHTAGDAVIRALARLLRRGLRRVDSVGRYGGEEFAVILPETDLANAAKALERIRDQFAGLRHSHGHEEFSITLSCGLARFPDCSDASRLNDAADNALYQAKAQGRNRVCVYSGSGSGSP
ncbi:MAG: diguanylate cyclase [Pseudomonadota bacterium]|nr:MAG: diguanylate cyclase [Pseudomonadota bacterium]